jgi:2-Cys peroxiredoxin 5
VQVPGFIEKSDDLIKAGIDEVIVYCVNDGAVMKAWAKDQQIDKAKGLITFMGDPSGALTKALDIELTDAGPASVGIIGRSKRTATIIDDGEVVFHAAAEKDCDPAGDEFPEVTCAPALLEALKSL